MGKLVIAIATALVLAACTADETPDSGTTGTSAATASPRQDPAPSTNASEQGTFLVRQGQEELYREKFQRIGDRIESTISHPAGGERVEQELRLKGDGTVESVSARVFSESDQPTQEWTVRMDRGTALMQLSFEGGTPESQSITVPPGTVPLLVNDSIILIEQVLRHATKAAGDSQQVSVLTVPEESSEPTAMNVTVTFNGPREARIEAPDRTLDVTTDGEGRILSARDTNEGITIQRE